MIKFVKKLEESIMKKFFMFFVCLLTVFLSFNFVNSILFDGSFVFLESFIYSLVFTLVFLGLEGDKEKKK
ncbi:hypothetical protein SIAG_01774 [Staphylococcus aureus subsp. aureus EMRSA16]|uniref:Uncharacterized protein n=2 Tax=Staphylococcus aureus TaxID=1280 RepID=A0A0E1X7V6_STAAU|nr:hypothetical protein SIAG_01774 [Staphylococcus aureus subsp. aureus EMRSA16]EFH95427.1 hypothetical protein HMPREF0769_11637 [Staphylococcus aureus subsp. aureus MN8]CAG39725.1 putative membrane protein [Staphylococcus aureus subsp. aureus MRSA252]